MRQTLRLLVLIALLLGGGGALWAQTGTASPASPHGDLAVPCADCHSPDSWKPARLTSRFDHSTSGFALEGNHAAAACTSCHTSLDFQGAAPTCASCHQDIHLGQLGATCADCHTSRGFTDRALMYRRHQVGRFPLDGPHLAVECTACHQPASQGLLQYTNLPTDCGSCHRATFQSTTNPDHGAAGFPTTCTDCHSRNEWRGGHFDHSTTAYPLLGAHATATCQDCHADGVFRGRDQGCMSCHVAAFNATSDPPHQAAQFPADCIMCHTGTTAWTGATFDHDAGRFPLVGAHRAVTCQDCHVGGVWVGRPTACASCHQVDFDDARSPDHRAAAFGMVCTDCHSQTAWAGGSFNHAATQFPLTLGHSQATCADCHADGVYRGKPLACFSCHQPDYDAVLAPNHRAANLPTDCTQCHTTAGFSGAAFDHGITRFPLTGGHLAASCLDCHADGVYGGRSMACFSCHQPDYEAVKAPDHVATSLPTDCTQCHSTGGWSGASFDHGTTQFPLTGAHLATTCQDCHADGVYRGKPVACLSCHQPDFAATAAPPHQALSFPADCLQCHTTVGWTGGSFDHATTQFPLTGSHGAVSCLDCHADGIYRGRSTACFTCHQPDYDGTLQPDHRAAALPTDCTLCHSTGAWGNTLFNHASTRFPLTGAHVQATCASCHTNNTYAGTPTTCASCHQADYNATRAPNHAASNLPTDCIQCHSTATWGGGSFNHATTNFPLTGAHLATTCLECHGDGVYSGKPTSCVSCHQQDYNGTTAPNHQASGFPPDCLACHTTTRWPSAVFQHSTTQFPLTGAHLAVTCQDCHADGVYRGKPTACMTCHQPDYNATTTPPHLALAFPADCTQCHTTAAWPGGIYNHSTTRFPLTGAHVATACVSCHIGGAYRGTATTCAGCHLPDYNATTNPRHSTAMFPTDCVSCHSTATWIGAQFNHDAQYFPIYSGAHRNKWSTCADCHTNSQNYAVFTCLSCHEHRKSEMDSKHQGRAGYSYTSTACYSCHPRGTH